MTTMIAIAALALGQGQAGPSGYGPMALLPMTKKGLGIGYGDDGAGKLDAMALVRPMGDPVVRRFPGDYSNMWYAEQRFEVLDSPDYQGSVITGFYAIHGVTDPNAPYSGRFIPARTLPLDEGRYLLVGLKQAADSIRFDFAYGVGPNSSAIPVDPGDGLNATVAGLFPVTNVKWAESGPRWRYVMETVAASMAYARAGALDDMTFLLRRSMRTAVPFYEGDGLNPRRDDPIKHQEERLMRIVRDVIDETAATATTMERLYYLSVLVTYKQDAVKFVDAVHRLVVEEGKDVPEGFDWPEVYLTPPHYVRPSDMLPYRAIETELLEASEKASAKRASSWAFYEIEMLEAAPEQRRYFALVPRWSVSGRELAYKKLIKWLALTDVTVETEDDGHGRTVRITNEEAVRAAISARLGS